MLLKRIRAFIVSIEFIITISIMIVLMYLFKSRNWQIRKNWSKLQTKFIGCDIKIEGKIDPNAKILLINHQSLLDIIVIEAIYPKDIAWVAKQEIADIPFFGHIVKATDMITIKREDRRSLIKLLKDIKDRVDKGRIIAIFPEGTRGDGKKLLKFKAGAKIASEKLNLIVQPVIVTNTKNILDSKRFLSNPGRVDVVFLDSIDPKLNKNWYSDVQTKMQQLLKKKLQIQ